MKSVLITGAASGLGKHLALRHAEKGNLVYAVDIDEDNLEKIASNNIVALSMDISKEEAWESVAAPVIEDRSGGLDIVVACAAVMRLGNVETCPVKDWRFVDNVNLAAQFITAKMTMKFLRKNRGNIVFIGSPSGLLAVKDEVCYVTFKHAIRGLNKSVAIDFGDHGVRANVVHPGWMRTAMSDQEMQEIMERDGCSLDEAYETATRFVPLKRPGSLDEICKAIDFLTSDDASYITGAELTVDGGLTIVDPGMIGFER